MRCYNCMHDKGDAAICPFCHKEGVTDIAIHHLVPGTVVGGRYTVGRVLGEGGFGITYLGFDNTLDITVAVKEYFPHGYSHRTGNITCSVSVSVGSDADFFRKGKDRFLREAKTVAKFLKDPGIVDIRDFFEENNTVYIVMEYLEGVDLRRYLKENGTITIEKALTLLTPVMRSLEKMHEAGVIHRDISPDNIMVLPDGSLKLMDFGSARDYDDNNRSMSVMLKHGYAPEEQYRRNGEQGPWTDVYGICATIYRAITGSKPDDAIDRMTDDPLKKPSESGVRISPAMEEVLMYGLAVKRSDRCQSMTELLLLIGLASDAPDRTLLIEKAEKIGTTKSHIFQKSGDTANLIRQNEFIDRSDSDETKTLSAERAPSQPKAKPLKQDLPKTKPIRKKGAWKKKLLITLAVILIAALGAAAVNFLVVPVSKTETDDGGYETTTEYMLFSGEKHSAELKDPDGRLLRKSKYEDDILTEEINYLPDSYRSDTTYDDEGKILTRETYDSGGNSVTSRSYEYDSKGNLIKETKFDSEHNRDYYWALEYDEMNAETKGTKFDDDDNKTAYRLVDSDSHGKAMKETYYNLDDGVDCWINCKYDPEGNILAMTYLTPATPADWRWDAEYDPDGHLLKMTEYNADDVVMMTFRFDSMGNLIGRINYDSDGASKRLS